MSRVERAPDPYWREDAALGEAPLVRGDTYSIRLRLHTERGPASRRHEIVPLSDAVRERVSVHGMLSILVPDLTLTVRLHDQPDPSGAIGAVAGSDWTGLRHEDIGQARGW